MKRSHMDPEGRRLPIKIDSTTNGETLPLPVKPRHIAVVETAQNAATQAAKSLSMGRRNFMTSAVGVATTLLAFNKVNAAMGESGGFFAEPQEAGLDKQLAEQTSKKFFTFDVQTHHFGMAGRWHNKYIEKMIPPLGRRLQCSGPGEHDDMTYFSCFTSDAYIKEIFLDSVTDVAVLTMFPSRADDMPLSMEEAALTRNSAAALQSSRRVLLHSRGSPHYPKIFATSPSCTGNGIPWQPRHTRNSIRGRTASGSTNAR